MKRSLFTCSRGGGTAQGRSPLYVAALLMLGFAQQSRADLVTFTFSGQVTEDAIGGCGSVVGCGPASVSYTFDSTASDGNLGSPAEGLYASSAITLSINGAPFFTAATGLITVFDSGFFDQYGLIATGVAINGSTANLSIQLPDPTGTAFGSDALPSNPSDLTNLLPGSLGTLSLIAPDDSFQLQGSIETIACTVGCGVTAIPEPMYAPLLAVGVAALIWFRKRKVRKASL